MIVCVCVRACFGDSDSDCDSVCVYASVCVPFACMTHGVAMSNFDANQPVIGTTRQYPVNKCCETTRDRTILNHVILPFSVPLYLHAWMTARREHTHMPARTHAHARALSLSLTL